MRAPPSSYRLVFYYWDSGKLGRLFHFNGNLLESESATQEFVAQAMRRPNTALPVRVNQEMRSSGGFLFNWRKALLCALPPCTATRSRCRPLPPAPPSAL